MAAVKSVLAVLAVLMASAAWAQQSPMPSGFILQFDLLKRATCKRASGCAHSFMLPQHSHMSEVYSINTADTRLTDDILDFVRTGK